MEPVSDPKEYRRTWLSWALYDVGNSAFFLVIVAAVFPIFYRSIYVPLHTPEGATLTKEAEMALRTDSASSLAFTAVIAMAIVAVLGPILGSIVDRTAAKKRFLAIFAAIGVAATALMFFIGPDTLLLAQVLYAVGTVGVAGSIVFYDALLPSVARKGELDRISTIGFAMGYAGSVLLLILLLVLIKKFELFGLPDEGAATRISFLAVAVWWALFCLPVLFKVPEPPARPSDASEGNVLLAGFRQLARTFGKLRRNKQLLLFLAAFWVYIDGVGTIIKLAVPFGDALGVEEFHLIMALIITQVVGIPCALGFGRLAKRIGAKKGILMGVAGYALICIFAQFLEESWHFYVLAISVGIVQGGVQALSRSLFATMIPQAQSAEFFGFFSTMEKFAGIIGPFILAMLWKGAGDPRPGIPFIALFFVIGGLLLWRVDVDEGRRIAAEEAKAS